MILITYEFIRRKTRQRCPFCLVVGCSWLATAKGNQNGQRYGIYVIMNYYEILVQLLRKMVRCDIFGSRARGVKLIGPCCNCRTVHSKSRNLFSRDFPENSKSKISWLTNSQEVWLNFYFLEIIRTRDRKKTCTRQVVGLTIFFFYFRNQLMKIYLLLINHKLWLFCSQTQWIKILFEFYHSLEEQRMSVA